MLFALFSALPPLFSANPKHLPTNKTHHSSGSRCDQWHTIPRELWETFQDIGNSTYVYSAYCDRRQSVVRVIAMTTTNTSRSLFCVMWYKNVSRPHVVPVEFLLWNHAGYALRTIKKVIYRKPKLPPFPPFDPSSFCHKYCPKTWTSLTPLKFKLILATRKYPQVLIHILELYVTPISIDQSHSQPHTPPPARFNKGCLHPPNTNKITFSTFNI